MESQRMGLTYTKVHIPKCQLGLFHGLPFCQTLIICWTIVANHFVACSLLKLTHWSLGIKLTTAVKLNHSLTPNSSWWMEISESGLWFSSSFVLVFMNRHWFSWKALTPVKWLKYCNDDADFCVCIFFLWRDQWVNLKQWTSWMLLWKFIHLTFEVAWCKRYWYLFVQHAPRDFKTSCAMPFWIKSSNQWKCVQNH